MKTLNVVKPVRRIFKHTDKEISDAIRALGYYSLWGKWPELCKSDKRYYISNWPKHALISLFWQLKSN